MKQWRVILEHNNKVKEIIVLGNRYSDVYIDVVGDYVGCSIYDIIEISTDVPDTPAHN